MPDVLCQRCKKPIALDEARESYTFPNDGRWMHSACVGALLCELLDLMRDCPLDERVHVYLSVQAPSYSVIVNERG